ncbi:MAG: hypothetical protein ACREBU_03525 [Nitrososphaera sp.]
MSMSRKVTRTKEPEATLIIESITPPVDPTEIIEMRKKKHTPYTPPENKTDWCFYLTSEIGPYEEDGKTAFFPSKSAAKRKRNILNHGARCGYYYVVKMPTIQKKLFDEDEGFLGVESWPPWV